MAKQTPKQPQTFPVAPFAHYTTSWQWDGIEPDRGRSYIISYYPSYADRRFSANAFVGGEQRLLIDLGMFPTFAKARDACLADAGPSHTLGDIGPADELADDGGK